eukprot:m.275398 g.275398  ORF g.275398 m.275398 type:complete len:205 (-) comp16293_c0_seq21:20-634(-)
MLCNYFVVVIILLTATRVVSECQKGQGQIYNGICIGPKWPPSWNYTRTVQVPPYLSLNKPSIININIGRQLFVDSFLINETDSSQQFYRSQYYEKNPIISPTLPHEGSFALPFSGGVWWQEDEQRIALWYRCGGNAADELQGRSGSNGTGTCLAYSKDGKQFVKPNLTIVPGTNFVHQISFDGNTVWLDHQEKNSSRKYKMAMM